MVVQAGASAGGLEPGRVEVRWIAVDPANTAAAEAAEAGGVLDAEERQQAARFRRDQDRALYRVAHVALRLVLAERLGRAPGELRFRRAACPGCGAAHGRPQPVDAPGLEFSLSHSGTMALVAVAADPIGADVELVAAFAPGSGTDVSGQLHPAERVELAALGEPGAERRGRATLRCWVRKEAYLKGTGMGLGRGADHDYVGLGPGYEAVAGAGAQPPAGWELRAVPVPAEYDAAIALRLPPGLPGAAVRVAAAELRLG
ncbi:4'-phosphopantetheinyl transferase family protein [Kitasatospora sp. LaBMicrA B282]|uniref:4'-phosphopantetheinyl transferase family protein n=1 Tax=Kitasatospora sp. LaBMicrA B282 TaxID=3420949 RepID=UPI003D0A5CD5